MISEPSPQLLNYAFTLYALRFTLFDFRFSWAKPSISFVTLAYSLDAITHPKRSTYSKSAQITHVILGASKTV